MNLCDAVAAHLRMNFWVTARLVSNVFRSLFSHVNLFYASVTFGLQLQPIECGGDCIASALSFLPSVGSIWIEIHFNKDFYRASDYIMLIPGFWPADLFVTPHISGRLNTVV